MIEKLDCNIDFSNSNIDKTCPYISISEVLGMLQEPFDSKGVAQKTYDKNYNNPESKYYHMTVEEIMESWSAKGAESCKYGSLLDDYIGMNLTENNSAKLEMWKLDNNYEWDERLLGLCNSFDHFIDVISASGNVKFIAREKTLYYKVPNTEYYIKGRFDALFYNEELKKYIVIDWKSSGSVDKKPTPWTKNLFGPMMRFPALNWYTYTTQVHFYKHALLNSGYLPEGTTPNDIVVLIVQLPGQILKNKKDYEIHQEAFDYDQALLEKLFQYAVKKRELQNEMEKS